MSDCRIHQDRVAIITGAAHGIGRATAERLAAEGARVVIADIQDALGEEVAANIVQAGGRARFMHTDVSVHEQLRSTFESTVAEWGQLDYLVNNAYINVRGSVTDVSEEDWDRSMNVNLKAYFLGCKYAFQEMQKTGGGSIVNLASVHAYGAWPSYITYETAKAGIVNMTRQLAIDGGPLGIRVNAVAPGWIITHHDWFREEAFAVARRIYPVGRPGRPDEVANAINFLLSDEASFISGHTLAVDGGLMAQLQDSPSLMDPGFQWI